MNNILRKPLALLLVMVLALSGIPAFAAEGGGEGEPSLGQSGTITGFTSIEPVKVDKGTPESDIPFPDAVEAMVLPEGDEAVETSIRIPAGSWSIADGTYDSEVEKPYVYQVERESLILPDGVTLPDHVDMPLVRVEVGEFDDGIMALTVAAPTTDTLDLANAIGDAVYTGGTSGTAAWDSTGKTLTLDSFVHTTSAATAVSLPADTTIVLNGVSSITSNTTSGDNAYGIYGDGALTFEAGDGSGNALYVIAGESTGAITDSYGIYTDGDLTVNSNCTLTSNSGDSANCSYGIKAQGDIAVNDSILSGNASASKYENYGIFAYAGISVTNGGMLGGQVLGSTESKSIGVKASDLITVDKSFLTGQGGEATDGVSYGIYALAGITAPSGTISGISGAATSESAGILSEENITVSRYGSVEGTSGDSNSGGSYGIKLDYDASLIASGNSTVNGTSGMGAGNYSIGILSNGGTVNGDASITGEGKAYGIYTDVAFTTASGSVKAVGGASSGATGTLTYSAPNYVSGSTVAKYVKLTAAASSLAAAPTVTAIPGDRKVMLTWTEVEGADSYLIYVNGTHRRTVSGLTVTIESLANDGEYKFEVEAADVNSQPISEKGVVKATPTAGSSLLPAPTVTATPGDGEVELSWTEVAGAYGYKVYINGQEASTVANSPATIPSLTNGTEYTFEVEAVDDTDAPISEKGEVKATPASGSSTPNYTLHVQAGDNKIYKNNASGGEATGLTGITWDGSALTLNNFNFTTTAKIGLEIPAGSTINLTGDNSIKSTYNDINASYGIIGSSGSGPLTIGGSGNLTATSGTSTNASSMGIYVIGQLTIADTATVLAVGGNSSKKSYGAYVNRLSVTGGSLAAQAGAGTAGSIALTVYDGEPTDVTVKGGASKDDASDLVYKNTVYTLENGTYAKYAVATKSSGSSTQNESLFFKGDGKLYIGTDENSIREAVAGQDYTGTATGTGTTITLSNFSFSTKAPIAMKLLSYCELVLVGTNTIASGDSTTTDCVGINATSALTLSGEGSLAVTAGNAKKSGLRSFGLTANSLTVIATSLTVKGGTASSQSVGIICTSGNISVAPGANVSAQGNSASTSIGVASSLGTIEMSGGTLSASTITVSGGTQIAIMTKTAISGAGVTVKGGVNKGDAFDLVHSSGGYMIENGDVAKYAAVTIPGAASIAGLTANPTTIDSSGGSSTITVAGTNLAAGITVTAFDGSNPAVPAITSTTDASEKTTLTFPANASTTDDKVYTIKASLNGGTDWASHTATVTVYKVGTTTYPLTVNSGSGDGNYASNTTVTITADSAPTGKVFDMWTGGNGGTFADANNATTIFTMPANTATVTATYKDSSGPSPINYTIAVSANPTNGGTASGDGTFADGTARTVTATPNSGYLFKNWTENGTEVSADANYTFTLTGDRNLVANFISGNVDVEVKPQGNAPATTLPDKAAVEDAVLTPQDLTDIQNGSDIAIILEVKEATPPAADQQAVDDSLQGQTLGMYLDISLFKQKNNGTPEAVTQLSKPIQIRFAVPAELAKSGRTFSVIRVHNGVAEVLPNLSTDPNYILVETDRFSTYALAYADATTPPPVQPPVNKPVGRPNNSGSSSGGSSGSGATTTAVRTTTPSNWLEPAPAKSLADKSAESYVRTKSTETYGVRKDAWPKLKGFQYQHDTRKDKSVQVRLYIPAPEKMAADTYVTGWVKGKTVDNRKAFFAKWFTNQVRVIHMDNPDPWGQEVQIAAKVDLAGMDNKRLYFYSYNKKTNSYALIEKPRYWIDEKGYLHFYTELAGDIIISEGMLTSRKQNNS